MLPFPAHFLYKETIPDPKARLVSTILPRMTTWIAALLFILLGLALIVPVVSWFLPRRTPEARAGFGPFTKLFLVALRLVIGWHFLVEGLDKFKGAWSSEAYLREASGPLAPVFRDLAGDRLVDQLTVAGTSIAPELEAEWDAYLDAFDRYYGLNAEQRARAGDILKQVKSDAVTALTTRPRKLEKISPEPPPLVVTMTMPERLKEHERLEAKVRDIEENLVPDKGPKAWDTLKTAKANLTKWRAGLQKDLNLINKEMKRSLRTFLLELAEQVLPADQKKKVEQARASVKKEIEKDTQANGAPDPADWDAVDAAKDRWDEKLLVAYRQAFFDVHYRAASSGKTDLDTQTLKIVENIIERQQGATVPVDPLPFRVTRPLSAWMLLDWSDAIVKYGVTAVGGLLLVGLFTRLACVAGAGFLFMFFIAMPPLPGWPESPRAEGHYLFINKNVIEMLALLALATTLSGRWLGLDALVHLLNPWRKADESVTITETPAA